jgi:hypothetical protein
MRLAFRPALADLKVSAMLEMGHHQLRSRKGRIQDSDVEY